jgi:hypothetical protein
MVFIVYRSLLLLLLLLLLRLSFRFRSSNAQYCFAYSTYTDALVRFACSSTNFLDMTLGHYDT